MKKCSTKIEPSWKFFITIGREVEKGKGLVGQFTQQYRVRKALMDELAEISL
jgi:hypothetical protein